MQLGKNYTVTEKLSQGLKQWLSTWLEGRANPGGLRCMQWLHAIACNFSVGSGGKGILLEIPVCLRPSEGKQLLSFISVPRAVAFEQVLACCSLGSCCSAGIAVLSITLQQGIEVIFEANYCRCSSTYSVGWAVCRKAKHRCFVSAT